ncbi:pleckstrin homology domain-containing family A member 5-like [Neolamprologus brichardi]|uniref:pleckstrin homology domain-containing family A member 5-like n=1 Tax=Neolamprologus brichardi TaxID=32507 RepID=UPI00164372EA|nr:pleckstrin homology domain-containing family A member 5-like [Neolamprologus brichardi]
MAADPQPDWLSCLPSSWSYGVTRDGRIFFINEEAKSTTWLHPVTGEAVITGHRKTPDLPTGWEEGYTFEGARCFINHNERKVTCKHPVSGFPSQDNCIFVVNEHVNCGKFVHPEKPVEAVTRSAPKSSSEQGSSSDKKERPMSTMSEASNYTGGSDYSTFTGSPATTVTTAITTSTSSTRPSRSSRKVHNFGKRSNSIKRNPNAPVVRSSWLYKQDSTGMKLWKKRWFVLSDMCLFYYRDEKEDSILGSILLPSFHISMLSVDDHISRKYAFKSQANISAQKPAQVGGSGCGAGEQQSGCSPTEVDGSRVPVKSPVQEPEKGLSRTSSIQQLEHWVHPQRRGLDDTPKSNELICQKCIAVVLLCCSVQPEELTLLLIKLRRQQAELNSLREHTVAQLMAVGMEGHNAKTDVLFHHLQRNLIYLESQTKENEPLIFMIHTMIENSAPRPQLYQQTGSEDYKDSAFVQRPEEADIDTKLSRLCEQDKAVRMQEEKLQQLHREKHTLETALLSASQELSEQSDSSAAATQSLVQQRDVLQNGLLSTCRELSRVSTVSMLSHITRHVATFMHEKQPQFYGIGLAAEYLLRVSQWTPKSAFPGVTVIHAGKVID